MTAQFGDVGFNADHFVCAESIRFLFQMVDGYFARIVDQGCEIGPVAQFDLYNTERSQRLRPELSRTVTKTKEMTVLVLKDVQHGYLCGLCDLSIWCEIKLIDPRLSSFPILSALFLLPRSAGLGHDWVRGNGHLDLDCPPQPYFPYVVAG
jgi:hypothetical protein